jgi:hypothetical protein
VMIEGGTSPLLQAVQALPGQGCAATYLACPCLRGGQLHQDCTVMEPRY